MRKDPNNIAVIIVLIFIFSVTIFSFLTQEEYVGEAILPLERGAQEGPGDGSPFPLELDGVTTSTDGDLTAHSLPTNECSDMKSTPIIVDDFIIFSSNDKTNEDCEEEGEYNDLLLAYNIDDETFYALADTGPAEGTSLYIEDEDILFVPSLTKTFNTIDPDSFEVIADGSDLWLTNDGSGIYFEETIYFGTTNTNLPICQGNDELDLNEDCGSIFAIDIGGNIVNQLNIEDDYRAWVAAGITSDGDYLYVSSSPQWYGEDDEEYLYGCSALKIDTDLSILEYDDPGNEGCHEIGNMEDSFGGELVIGLGNAIWAQSVAPDDDDDNNLAVIRYDNNMNEICRIEIEGGSQDDKSGSFYGAPTIDREGNVYFTYTIFDEEELAKEGHLYKASLNCDETLLASVEDTQAFASPTLADDTFVLFVTDGLLQILYQEDGTVYEEYDLGSTSKVMPGPVIHEGVIYILQNDGTFNVIENSGLEDYGNAVWPRYRHDNYGTGIEEANIPEDPDTLDVDSASSIEGSSFGLEIFEE